MKKVFKKLCYYCIVVNSIYLYLNEYEEFYLNYSKLFWLINKSIWIVYLI